MFGGLLQPNDVLDAVKKSLDKAKFTEDERLDEIYSTEPDKTKMLTDLAVQSVGPLGVVRLIVRKLRKVSKDETETQEVRDFASSLLKVYEDTATDATVMS